MQAKLMVAALMLAAPTAGAAPMSHHAGGKGLGASVKPCCAVCSQMMKSGQKMSGMSGGMAGGMMNSPMTGQIQPMMGRMQGTGTPPTVTVASDGTILVLRGGTLYKYSAGLKLLGSVQLPAAAPPSAMNMDPPAARPGR